MKIIGEKLRIARILAGYSITELASSLDITKQSLSQYENGVEPKLDVYFKLLNVLGCKSEFLTTPLSKNSAIKNNFFRASAAADAIERKNQETKTNLAVNLYRFLEDYLELPNLNLPDFPENSSIEEKTGILRQYWGLANRPIKNMLNCLESNGIIVSSFNSGGRLSYKIDGYTQQLEPLNQNGKDSFCVIVENNKESWARKNFSLAHELGHIILHSSDSYIELSKTEQNQLEIEANLFASAFLLPSEEFSKDMKNVYKLEDFVPLKSKWYVSIGAMMIRAKQLGILSNDQYLRLIKRYSYYQYRNGEPLDDEIKIFQPILFKRSLELLFENGFTLEQFEYDLSEAGLALKLDQIEELLCLNKGFFDKYRNESTVPVIRFKTSR